MTTESDGGLARLPNTQEPTTPDATVTLDAGANQPDANTNDGDAASADSQTAPTCGEACGPNHECDKGNCLLKDGSECKSNADCLSGACTLFYVDKDGDSYGTGQGESLCGSVLVGYSQTGGDCCDEPEVDSARNVHPGQTLWFDEPAKNCKRMKLQYDYNCDGAVDRAPPGILCDPKQDPQCAGVNIEPLIGAWECGRVPADYEWCMSRVGTDNGGTVCEGTPLDAFKKVACH